MTVPLRTQQRGAPASAPGAARPDLKELPDSEVVAAYLQGTTRAFDEIVDRYQKRLLNFVFRTIGVANNARVCPAVFWIVEQMKRRVLR